jgi:ribosome maturation factor RimP
VGGSFQPIFFGPAAGGVGRFAILVRKTEESEPLNAPAHTGAASSLACVARTVEGLGFELVDVERAGRGLLRVYIDRVPGRAYPQAQGEGGFVTVDDCEVVTRQLQLALEVNAVGYERLEVSSPGLDRPLRKPADFERFSGHAVDITLKQAYQSRKHWRGVLGRADGQGWRLVLQGDKVGTELLFTLDELREARLVPVIDFKGRGRGAPSAG